MYSVPMSVHSSENPCNRSHSSGVNLRTLDCTRTTLLRFRLEPPFGFDCNVPFIVSFSVAFRQSTAAHTADDPCAVSVLLIPSSEIFGSYKAFSPWLNVARSIEITNWSLFAARVADLLS